MTAPLTEAEIDALEALDKARTQGEWSSLGGRITAHSGNALDDEPLSIADCDMDMRIDYDIGATANAAFIAAAANALPRLLAEHRASREREARLREALALLVADVSQYEAWRRPCHALDVARAALGGSHE